MKNRKLRLSPATVIAVIALVFALGGTAVAAKRYLITNPKQISPAVLKKLATLASNQVKAGAPGTPGAAGTSGTPGQSGERGATGPGAVVYWAVVEANGTLNRHGTGEVSDQKIGEGTYVVNFDADITKCGYEAVVGLPGDENGAYPGFATVAQRNNDPDGVFIQTYAPTSSTPALEDKSFHLAVFC